jgi:threonine/homoserine/homoserine lactone efflux protein
VNELLIAATTWWVISLSGVLAPGPISAMSVTEGARRGAIAGPLITLGHAVPETAMVAALGFGLSRVLGQPAVVGAIGFLGGLVLVWMGWGIVQTARVDSLTLGAADARAAGGHTGRHGRGIDGRGLIGTGILLTIGNPYWLLWWATVGATYYVAFSRFGMFAIVIVFLAGHLALDLGWNTFLALVVGAGRGRVPDVVYRGVLGVCGVAVAGFGGYFVVSGLRFLIDR